MRHWLRFVIAAPCVVLTLANAPLAPAGEASAPIPGYLDVRSGIFYPLTRSADVPPAGTEANAAATTMTGTIVIEATVKLDATIKSTDTVSATAVASVSDPVPTSGTYYTYSSSQYQMVSPSGSTAKFKISVPYIWTLANTSDKVFISFYVSTNTSGTAFYSNTISLPANGATTKVTIGSGI
jgi:hypothetical protein